MTEQIVYPAKTEELRCHTLDSVRWNGFEFRDGDIIIGTWAKSGTTWTQQIVGQLLFDGDPDLYGSAISPWPDFRIALTAVEDAKAQTHRRFLKTHLPVEALGIHPEVKYIYIARDVRDVAWSWHHHHMSFSPLAYELLNGVPDLVGPPIAPINPDIRAYYHQFLDGDGSPNWPFWSHVQGWWDARTLPNVLLLHYADMLAEPAKNVRRIAAFLDIPLSDDLLAKTLEHSTVGYMKDLAAKQPMLDMVFDGGGRTFINEGTNGRWKDVLSAEEIAKADIEAAKHLIPDCAHWLKTGEGWPPA